MKRILLAFILTMAVSGAAYADGNAFTPLNFNDTTYGKPLTNSYTPPQQVGATSETDAIGNGNIQNAISQFENAQVDIRNELLNYKTKYADVDAQYKIIKADRANLKKQVKATERRIKAIDKLKEKSRKTML